MNVITVAGTLGKDAEMRSMPDGTPIASFSVADSQGREKPTIWWAAQIFGNRAKSLQPYLVKGASVTVSGTVTEREWTDKDGQKRKSMDVRVNDVALQGGKREGEAPRSKPAAKSQAAPAGGDGFDDLADDIPF